MDLVLGIDLGTSYFKLGLFDREGRVQGFGRVFVPKDTLDGTRCELAVERFWMLLRQGLSLACKQAKTNAGDIKAVAYSSQANSFVLLDNDNQPLTALILWPDSRVEKVGSAVQELWHRSDFLKTTGLGIKSSVQFCVAKLRWFQKNLASLWSDAHRIMTISDYLTFSLTGHTAGDMGTASLLGLLDLQKEQWWDDALAMLGLSRSQLSTPFKPGTLIGELDNDGAQYLGLQGGIPFALGSLDHHTAAIGAGAGSIAEASESTGTVLTCLRYSEQYNPRPDCCMGPGTDDDYYQLAFNDNGAGTLEWYQKQHASNLSIDELVQMAESVQIGSEGLIAKSVASRYDGLKGFGNISTSHQHGHFVRAIMESTAASLAGLMNCLYGNDKPGCVVGTGGGTRSDLWLQMKADLLGTEFVKTDCQEPACLGAAMFASIAAGWFENLADVRRAWVSVKSRFLPKPANHATYSRWYKRYLEEITSG